MKLTTSIESWALQSADIVMFKDHFTMPTFRRPPSQLWLLYMLECPLHTQVSILFTFQIIET